MAGTLIDAAQPNDAAAADALRLQVLNYIRAHLADPDLTRTHGCGALHGYRTLHRLFEHEPHTVTDYIRV